MPTLTRQHWLLIIGMTIGVAYGIATRLVFGQQETLASVTYLFVIPMILGMIPLVFTDPAKLTAYRNFIFIPWVTVAAFLLTLILFGLEDVLCLLVLAFPFFVLGTIGGFAFRLFQLHRRKNKEKLLAVVLLPFLLIFLESTIHTPSAVYEVSNEVRISASAETIWNNIVEVPEIDSEEYEAGLFNALGIPRPISASVDKQKIGGQRIGHFEGGLTFVETITDFQPGKRVSFDIRIDPTTVSNKVFEQHVLRGTYFSFVDATYHLSEQSNGDVILTLTSSYQLTSTINFYGKFWGDLILSDFQARLLDVIEGRCEGE
jgi:hypothetical protein